MVQILKLFLMTGVFLASGYSASAGDKHHNDAFVRGPEGESRVAQQVRHELLMLPYYSVFDDLAFRVEGSTVTLYGVVTNPTLKSDAGNVVKRVEGVTNVVNEIKVL